MRAAGVVGYLGGLAAAAGAGAVLGLTVAAPAAADDSAPGPAHRTTEHSSPASHTAALGAPAASVAATRAARSAAASPVSKVAVAQNNSVPVSTSPTLPAVAAQSARRQGLLAAPANLPTAAAAATVANVRSQPSAASTPVYSTAGTPTAAVSTPSPHNFYLDPRGQRITVLKGLHFAIPARFGLFIKQVYGTGTFTADSSYDLKDVDQYDWNKFSGIAFTPLQPDKNSAMVGWRYNLKSGEYEIAPFFNVNQERILPDEQTEVISVPTDKTFQYRVDYTGVTVSYGDRTVFKPYPPELKPNVWTAARVSGWFGGNEAAPRTLSYYLSFNWW